LQPCGKSVPAMCVSTQSSPPYHCRSHHHHPSPCSIRIFIYPVLNIPGRGDGLNSKKFSASDDTSGELENSSLSPPYFVFPQGDWSDRSFGSFNLVISFLNFKLTHKHFLQAVMSLSRCAQSIHFHRVPSLIAHSPMT